MYESMVINKFLDANISIVEFESRKMVCANFFREVDLSAIEKLRATNSESKVPYTAFVVKAVAKAMEEYSYVNGRLFENWLFRFYKKIVRFSNIDVAVAVERSGPELDGVAFCDIIRSADKMPLAEITKILKELTNANESNNKQWREFSLLIQKFPRWLTKIILRLPCYFPNMWIKYRGGAVVVSSPAKYGVDFISANWIWPLGVSFGLVSKKPLVKNDQIVICPTFILTLSFDRRMLAGAQTAKFFNRIVFHLENP